MLLRDRLRARMDAMGGEVDHQRLATEVLGIRGAPPELARRLVAQALVMEDRREVWTSAGERICATAPQAPGVYVLRDAEGRALYVGKAVNLRRRLRAHFSARRWRGLKADMSRAESAEWREVGSELEALLREAATIAELRPAANIQVGAPDAASRAIPRALLRDTLIIVPSIEKDSVELIGARVDGRWMIQRTRRSGADLAVHVGRVSQFFKRKGTRGHGPLLAPVVFSWLADRGAAATRFDPHDAKPRELRRRLAAVFGDERLFVERLDQR